MLLSHNFVCSHFVLCSYYCFLQSYCTWGTVNNWCQCIEFFKQKNNKSICSGRSISNLSQFIVSRKPVNIKIMGNVNYNYHACIGKEDPFLNVYICIIVAEEGSQFCIFLNIYPKKLAELIIFEYLSHSNSTLVSFEIF